MTSSSQKSLLAEFAYDHVFELLVPTTLQGLKNLASIAIHKRVYRLLKFVWRDVLEVRISLALIMVQLLVFLVLWN